MSQLARFSDRCAAPCQCLVRKAETEKDNPQERPCCHMGVNCGLLEKRAVGDPIIKCKHLFQVRAGWRKPADKPQVSTGGGVSQKEPGGIVALTAQTQQILVQALRQIEFAAVGVIE